MDFYIITMVGSGFRETIVYNTHLCARSREEAQGHALNQWQSRFPYANITKWDVKRIPKDEMAGIARTVLNVPDSVDLYDEEEEGAGY